MLLGELFGFRSLFSFGPLKVRALLFIIHHDSPPSTSIRGYRQNDVDHILSIDLAPDYRSRLGRLPVCAKQTTSTRHTERQREERIQQQWNYHRAHERVCLRLCLVK